MRFTLLAGSGRKMMVAIKQLSLASLSLFVSLCYASAQNDDGSMNQSGNLVRHVSSDWDSDQIVRRDYIQEHNLRPRSITQLASLPKMNLKKRGRPEPIAYLGKRPSTVARTWDTIKHTVSSPLRRLGQAVLSLKQRSEEALELNTEKKPRYLGHRRDLVEVEPELIVIERENGPDENEILIRRTPGHTEGDLVWKQNRKEKMLKAGKHETWMDMVPDKDGLFDPTVYSGSGVPKMIHDMKTKLEKQGIHKDWMDKPAAKNVSKRDEDKDESNILIKRTPGHSKTNLEWKQNEKEKMLKAGKHEAWMDKVPNKNSSPKLKKRGIQKDWTVEPAAKNVSKRNEEEDESNNLIKRRTGHAAAIDVANFEKYEKKELQAKGLYPLNERQEQTVKEEQLIKRNLIIDVKEVKSTSNYKRSLGDLENEESDLKPRSYTVADMSKCNMPLEKTGPSGNKVVLTTGCQYHGLGFGTGKQKREVKETGIKLQKRFVILPPTESEKGIRFDVAREKEAIAKDGFVFLKRSPTPYAALVTAATSFASSFQQARNNRHQTVVLNSDPDGNITGARTMGGPKKLININFVSRPSQRYQHQNQVY